MAVGTVKAQADGPVLIHAVTKKGKGYAPAESSADRGHARARFDVVTGEQAKAKSNAPSYTSVFAKALIAQAERDEKIVAITMPSRVTPMNSTASFSSVRPKPPRTRPLASIGT